MASTNEPLPKEHAASDRPVPVEEKNDHVWFVNRAAAADGDEVGGSADGTPSRIDCCIRGPEIIELTRKATC